MKNIIRTGLALALALLLGLAFAPGLARATGPAHQAASPARVTYPPGTPDITDLPVWVRRYCPDESTNNCFWDAGASGSGGGYSYIVRAIPNSGGLVCIFYSDPTFASNHDWCSKNL